MKGRVLLLLGLLTVAFIVGHAQPQEASDSADLVDAAKAFVALLEKGDFEAATAQFDDKMKGLIPAEKLAAVWGSLATRAGAFEGQTGTRVKAVGAHTAVFVTCMFERASVDARVVLDGTGKVAGLFFSPARSAPTPKPPETQSDAFREEDVRVGSGVWSLPGTLSLPAGSGPFPALVLVHGSGPLDRDGTVGPNRPFRDLAHGLAERGIAVLRYEKRTKAHPERLMDTEGGFTVREETVDDALAAVSLLRGREEIDSRRVFVLGHSLGGMLAPRMGDADPRIAGFVVMAGPNRPIGDHIVVQMTYIFNLDGDVSDSEKTHLARVEAEVARIKDPALSASTPGLLLGAPAAYWLDLRGYRPAEAARSLTQPMLVLQGGRDYQVTAEDFEGWKQALSSREDVSFKFYPELNHLFMTGEGKPGPGEYQVAGHVAGAVMEDIAAWIKTVRR